GKEIATFLTRLPKLLPVFYPFCYLLKKPEDIAQVLCQVAVDDRWDHTAKLPAIHGNVLWALGGQTLSNLFLNQLMQALGQINTPRSQLMQAYLLIHVARDLDAEFTIENGDEPATAIFTMLKKCHHDALKILES
ncbi:MAG: hypothetical protein M3R00_08200, partial [Pseudomonadota bacterium]|nr:hypothetical protein [Pseudomonadota bacterium]